MNISRGSVFEDLSVRARRRPLPSDDRPIRIGIGAPLSGRARLLGLEMVQAAQLAVDDVNSAGGLCGRSVEAIIGDDEGDVTEGSQLAERFVRDPDVIAVVGHYNSDVTLAASTIYERAAVPLIAPIVSNPALTERGLAHVFRFTNRDDRTAAAIAAHLVHRRNKRRAAVVASATTYGTSMALEFARAFSRRGGEIVFRRDIPEGAEDLRPVVNAFPSAFDMVFYGGTFEGAPLLRALRGAGRAQLLATGDGCWDVANFLKPVDTLASQGEGVLVLSACPAVGVVPGSEDLARRYEERFGAIRNYAVNSYDATMTLLDAIREASRESRSRPRRSDVLIFLSQTSRRGLAYPSRTTWDRLGDNFAAVTALHDVVDGRFRQLELVDRLDPVD